MERREEGKEGVDKLQQEGRKDRSSGGKKEGLNKRRKEGSGDWRKHSCTSELITKKSSKYFP